MKESILFKPAVVATMANAHGIYDLEILLKSLQIWNVEPPTIYIVCCSAVSDYLDNNTYYKGTIHRKVTLDMYTGLNRSKMERLPTSKGLRNMWHDFMEEKCDLMKWALESLPSDQKMNGVLFCDADICWLGPLPELPTGKVLGLSPHMIKKRDEDLYGMYNGGFFWTNQLEMPDKWHSASKVSRFYEQAALENLADSTTDDELYLFGSEFNYGWWRMFQSSNSIQNQKKQWMIQTDETGSHTGIYVENKPLRCIHTHWRPTDSVTLTFNLWIIECLENTKDQPNVKKLMDIVRLGT